LDFEQPAKATKADVNPNAMNFMMVTVFSLQNRQGVINFSARF
jgi:hypothetical protein